MEFLVRIEQNISPDMDPDRLADLKHAEHARGTELAEAGVMRRIWRNPGRRGVWVLYEVDGPDELHATVLPARSVMVVAVLRTSLRRPISSSRLGFGSPIRIALPNPVE